MLVNQTLAGKPEALVLGAEGPMSLGCSWLLQG